MTHGMMIIGSMRPRVKRRRIKVSAEVGRQWPVEAVVCVQWLVASKGRGKAGSWVSLELRRFGVA